jgi:hypothetical protein
MAADLADVMDTTPHKRTMENATELNIRCREAACSALALKRAMNGEPEPRRGD